jgi:hypothetical protein
MVCSRGQPIGETDLGFPPVVERCRMGWFHPSAEGERVMSIAAAPSPVIRAYRQRQEREASGAAPGEPMPDRATLLADLAEAAQHLSALELTLHRDDGTLVRTRIISFQDMRHLLELARLDELGGLDELEGVDGLDGLEDLEDEGGDDALAWEMDDGLFATEEFGGGGSHRSDEAGCSGAGSPERDPQDDWTPPAPPAGERYQIHVELMEGEPLE